jgi:hypothetical protein
MADVKISALPAATTPLAGTEVLPIVQSGTTDQVSVANLTAGRTVNGAAFTASGTVSGATVTASGTVSGATVSGTTVNAGAGSAAAPSISPTGDSNTGIYFPAADTIAFAEGGVEALRLDSSGNAIFTGTTVMASSFLRNRLINGNMYIAQRATSATVTAGTGVPTASTGYPCVDRFFVYSTGANVTAAQVSGAGANRNLLRITGAASVTAVGIGQRIEAVNSIDLAGQTCTLSVDLANSLLTTVTWTANYATTADTFGTIGTPTKTQIATGTFTVTSTLTRYSVNIAVPAAATTGVEILFTVGAQTSGTWDVGNVQFEAGSAATPFERRQFGQEFLLCQRYYRQSSVFQTSAVGYFLSYFGGTSAVSPQQEFSPPMRVTPTGSFINAGVEYYSYGAAWTATTLIAFAYNNTTYQITCASDGDGRGKLLRNSGNNPALQPFALWSAEL